MKTGAEFAFVILHYLAMDRTENALKSIRENMVGEKYHVVIVDNASPDRSGKRLAEVYGDDEDVTVLMSESNLGFAGGNNLGYSWCRDNLDREYICVMNNDAALISPEFADKVRKIHTETSCAVLGPDIYCPLTGKHQSPSGLDIPTPESVSTKLNRRRKINSFFPLGYLTLRKEEAKKRKKVHPKDSWWETGRENVVLHGAFYIFCPSFIRSMAVAFEPLGFMYFEEETLAYICNKKGLKMVYSPDIQVYHYDDRATDRAFGTGYRKARFKSIELEKSMGALLRYMSEA